MIIMQKIKECLVFSVATVFGIGKIPFGPGTFGSIAAFPIGYILFIASIKIASLFLSNEPSDYNILWILGVFFLLVILLTIVGTICSSIYAKKLAKDDPSEIVIDEVVGQLLVVLFTIFASPFFSYIKLTKDLSDNWVHAIYLVILPLALFRFFDILKPWPINYLDRKVKGGMGIMLDDIVAAIFAGIIYYAIILMLI